MCGGGGGGGGGDGADANGNGVGVDAGAPAGGDPNGSPGAVAGPAEGGGGYYHANPVFIPPAMSAVSQTPDMTGQATSAPSGPRRLIQARPGPDLFSDDQEYIRSQAPTMVGSSPVARAVSSAWG
jgi:hypothetical protein